MSRLLDEVLAAHGGLERWQAVTALTADGTFDGLLRSRFPGSRLAIETVRFSWQNSTPSFMVSRKRISWGGVRSRRCSDRDQGWRPDHRSP